MDPIDYSINVATPFQSAMQGYQAGAAVRDDQAQQAALVAQKQAQQNQQQMLVQLANNPNATGADYARVMTLAPGLAEPLTKAWNSLNTAQQQTHLADLSQWGASIKAGQPQIAVDLMNARADAMEKASGPNEKSQALRAAAGVVKEHPQFALGAMIIPQLSAHPDGSKVATTLAALGKEDREAALAPAELVIKKAEAGIKGAEAAVAPTKVATDIANVQSQITDRAKRFGLDSDKLTTETQIKLQEMADKRGELPEFVAKDVSSATTEALAAAQSATRMNQLATQIEAAQAELGSGVTAKTGELWKKTFGSQNELTRLRAEFARIVTPAAMAAYKTVASGSTSDKDIETAMVGVPKDTDNPERMAAFLRGAAKLQIYDSVLNNAKSEWLGAVRNLGKAARDIEVDGVQVPAGTTFKNFADQYVQKKVAEQTAASVLPSRGYMRFAEPAAGVVPAAPVSPVIGD